MDFQLSEERAAIRDMAEDFAAGAIAPHALDWDRDRHFPLDVLKQAAELGLGGLMVSDSHGGTGLGRFESVLVYEALAKGCPAISAYLSIHNMVGTMIDRHGSDAQRAHYLPRLLAGEDYWCQGYSEPGSGSDLASLQLRADRVGDEYILNGSKIWTTHAHHATRMFCLVRTRREGKPQEGITFLLLNMKQPGITVDPIISISGEHELNQVFFEDARVPVANRLGEENDGWTVAKYLLEFERGGGSSVGLEAGLRRVRAVIEADAAMDPALRQRAANLAVQIEALMATEKRVMASLTRGQPPGPAASLLKIQRTELMQKVDEVAVEASGAYVGVRQLEACEPRSNQAPLGPEGLVTAAPRYLNNRAASIYGGSNEVQRNIIAKAVLRL